MGFRSLTEEQRNLILDALIELQDQFFEAHGLELEFGATGEQGSPWIDVSDTEGNWIADIQIFDAAIRRRREELAGQS